MVHALGISPVQCLFFLGGRIFLVSGSCQSCILLCYVMLIDDFCLAKAGNLQATLWLLRSGNWVEIWLLAARGWVGSWVGIRCLLSEMVKVESGCFWREGTSSAYPVWLQQVGTLRRLWTFWDLFAKGNLPGHKQPIDAVRWRWICGKPVDPVAYFPCISRTKTSLVQGNLPWRRHLWEKAHTSGGFGLPRPAGWGSAFFWGFCC